MKIKLATILVVISTQTYADGIGNPWFNSMALEDRLETNELIETCSEDDSRYNINLDCIIAGKMATGLVNRAQGIAISHSDLRVLEGHWQQFVQQQTKVIKNRVIAADQANDYVYQGFIEALGYDKATELYKTWVKTHQ